MFWFIFFHCSSFSPCISGRWHFSFCHRRYKIFLLFFQQKNTSFFVFISRPRPLSPFSRWASLACRKLSLFLCLSLVLYSKFVDMTINLILILLTTRVQKLFPLSVFVFIDSSVVSFSFSLSDYKTWMAVRFPTKIASSCIWVAVPVDWVILHWYACGADARRLVGVRSHDYQIFLDG